MHLMPIYHPISFSFHDTPNCTHDQIKTESTSYPLHAAQKFVLIPYKSYNYNTIIFQCTSCPSIIPYHSHSMTLQTVHMTKLKPNPHHIHYMQLRNSYSFHINPTITTQSYSNAPHAHLSSHIILIP